MKFLTVIKRKFSTVNSMSAGEKWLFFQVFVLLGIARFSVLVLPFRWIAKILGKKQQETSTDGLLANEKDIVQNISKSIKLASRYTPWNSNCMAQAITANRLLKKQKISSTMYFGIAKQELKSSIDEAHAWVRCGRFYVVGGNGTVNYSIVASFATEI